MIEDLTGTPEEIALLEGWRAEILAAGGRIPRGDEDDTEDDFGDDSEDDFEDDDEDDEPDPDEVARAAERAATFAAARTMAGPGASASTINRAAAILRHGVPELVAAVRTGALTFQRGAAIVRLPATDQPGALAAELTKRTARKTRREAAAQKIAKRKAHREARWAAKRGEREARAARARERQERRDEKADREYAARIAARREAEPDLLEDRIGYRERIARGEA